MVGVSWPMCQAFANKVASSGSTKPQTIGEGTKKEGDCGESERSNGKSVTGCAARVGFPCGAAEQQRSETGRQMPSPPKERQMLPTLPAEKIARLRRLVSEEFLGVAFFFSAREAEGDWF